MLGLRSELWMFMALAILVMLLGDTSVLLRLHHNNGDQMQRYPIKTQVDHWAPMEVLNHHRHHASRVQASAEFDSAENVSWIMLSDQDTGFSLDNVYHGKLITEILRGEKDFPKHHQGRLKFHPGTLQMPSVESLKYCFVNTSHYQNQIDNRNIFINSVSNQYKIIYRNVPKSASSSSRHIMVKFFNGSDTPLKYKEARGLVDDQNYTIVSFIRDPLDRFFSSYDEAFFRMGPWMDNGPLGENQPVLRNVYLKNKYKLDPYPYLYKDIHNISQFRTLYCPKDVLELNYVECNDVESIDDGNLAKRFEQFVLEYDGKTPFDNHLNLQVTFLVHNAQLGAYPLPVGKIFNASEAHKGWVDIAREVGVEMAQNELVHGRGKTRRFNVTRIPDSIKKRICRLVALDYCCLNLELPDVCKLDLEGDEDPIFCAMDRNDMKNRDKRIFTIQSWHE